jgi:Holliday junction resolvase RusA-like endonuclease
VPNNTKAWVPKGGRFAKFYKTPKVTEYKDLIASHVVDYCIKNKFKPFDVPVAMTLYVYLTPPASWSKKRREEVIRNSQPFGVKPDITNLEKLIEDSISKDAWNKTGYYLLENDSLICEKHSYKNYASENYIVIELIEIKKPSEKG